MIKFNLIVTVLLCAACVYPATQAFTRHFTSKWHDLRVALHRYGRCYGDLPALTGQSLNETEYLVNQIKSFLDQGNYENEQLANVTALMDSICRVDDSSYAISVNIDVNRYNNSASGKLNRCRSIDEAMDSMYFVFRKAALNTSEPLDFSSILFYPNRTNPSASYNLTDLINTSWIKSDTHLEHVCTITSAVKQYIQSRTRNSTTQARDSPGYLSAVFEFVNRLLDRIFGVQKRLYWDSTNRAETLYRGFSRQVGNLRDLIGRGFNSTRSVISGTISSSSPISNSTLVSSNLTMANSTISN